MTEELGRRLKAHLAERGWSQTVLVRESGVDKNTLSGLINGKTAPRPATLGRLEKALGLDSGALTAPAEDARPGERAKLAGVSDAELIAELSYRIEGLRREVGKGNDNGADEGGV